MTRRSTTPLHAVMLVLSMLLAMALPATAAARDVTLHVEGCVEVAMIRGALALELAPGWRIVETGAEALHVEIVVPDCESTSWTARIVDDRGLVVRGPVDLAMSGFPATSRGRIAALWIAEWLATLTGEGASPASEALAPSTPRAEEAAPERLDAGGPGPSPEHAADPSAPAREAPLLVRIVALGSFRQVPDTPASLGGLDLGVQVARGGLPGIGVELSGGVEGGTQWSYGMLVARGSLSAFAVLAPESWSIEVDVGARATLEVLAAYTRGRPGEQLLGAVHGLVGGFVRTLVYVIPRLALAVDLELAASPAPVSYVAPAGGVDPGASAGLLEGFSFAARLGIVAP